MNLTPKRREWLERLRDCGPARRAKSNVGYMCMTAGWTDWWVTLDDGREMSMSEARALYPPSETDSYWNHLVRPGDGFRECIKDAGRAALAA